MKLIKPLQFWVLQNKLRKRTRKAIKRKIKRWKHKLKKIKLENYKTPLLSYISKYGFVKDNVLKPKNSHIYHILIPKIFSLIENPDISLNTLEQIAQATRDKKIQELFLDHSQCDILDIDASAIMDILIVDAKKEWKIKNHAVNLHGLYSKVNPKVNEILKITGLIKHIGHSDSDTVPMDTKTQYKIFDLYKGTKTEEPNPYRSTEAEHVTTKLTKYFDEILQKSDRELNSDGKNYLSSLIGEVIDNAEQHSDNKTWYVIGYMDELKNKTGRVNITILDFGNSIHKTISEADLVPETKKNIEQLIFKHTTKNLFNFEEKWTPENLWTLFALQEGISRFNTQYSEKDRGYGTIEMIEFFLDLAQLSYYIKPSMIILSKSTYILFDGTYRLNEINIDGQFRKIIAFNKNNTLEEKPDHKFVRNLKNKFPGTIISMKFYIHNDFLSNYISKRK